MVFIPFLSRYNVALPVFASCFLESVAALPAPGDLKTNLHQMSERAYFYTVPSTITDSNIMQSLSNSQPSDSQQTTLGNWVSDAVALAAAGASDLSSIVDIQSDPSSWNSLSTSEKDRILSNFNAFFGSPAAEQDQEGNITNLDELRSFFVAVGSLRGKNHIRLQMRLD
jgi:hypothetical protein